MKGQLKDLTKKHYEAYQLSPRQLDQLKATEQRFSGQINHTFIQNKLFWPLSALVAGIFIVVFSLPQQDDFSPDRIANEIAYNYNKTLSMEFKGNSIPEIREHFNKLDFNLVNSSNNRISNLRLVGGRYSSINKQLAAQLRLAKQKGHSQMIWYQIPLTSKKMKLNKEVEFYQNGVRIIMWTEKGVLHGLAGKP